MNDDQLRERFGRVEFAGEPPMASTALHDLDRGRRYVRRRRRTAAVGGGVLGVAAAATGVVLLLPGGSPAGAGDLPVAEAGAAPGTSAPPDDVATPTPSSAPDPYGDKASESFPFPLTRQLLLDTAVEHLDPAHEHLPATSYNFGGGDHTVPDVSTRVRWTNDGDDGQSGVRLAVTGAGYAESSEHAVSDFLAFFGCDVQGYCGEAPGPDGETVLVAPPDPETGRLFAVSYQRPDGSMVSVTVDDVLGTDSAVDITEEQAIAFVTDPDLRVHPDEADGGGVVRGEGRSAEELGDAVTPAE